MYAEERQQEILQLARRDGRVDVTALAAHFDVSRRRSAATSPPWSGSGCCAGCTAGRSRSSGCALEPALPVRAATRRVQKERIAKAALAELAGATTVLLDAGTTTARLAELLPADRELTVVTNALPIARCWRPARRHRAAGRRPGATARTLADGRRVGRAALDDLHVDVAFLGTNGITVDAASPPPTRPRPPSSGR